MTKNSTTTFTLKNEPQFVLVNKEHGFNDYDVIGLHPVHRVCVSHKIRRSDVFNVYCADNIKMGAMWESSLERSMATFAKAHIAPI